MASETTTQAPPYGSTATPNTSRASPTNVLPNTSTASPTNVLDRIAAADLISTANHVYAFLAAAALMASCFLIYHFVRTYGAQRRAAWPDRLLWAFSCIQLLLVLFSFYNVAHRPHSLRTTPLSCATLAFVINLTSLCGLLILALIAYLLALDPPLDFLLRRPGVSAALLVPTATLISLILAGIRGPRDSLQRETDCFMDPVQAGVSYAVAKLCLAFLAPYILQIAIVLSGCAKERNSKGRFLLGKKESSMYLSVNAVLFFCHLFYNVALVRAARQQTRGELSHRERAFISIAELVFFAGSGVSLLLVLITSKPSREKLSGLFGLIVNCCPRVHKHAQPNRNIITPHIEITDTLQDIES
ncbi:uncharacterized protein LOC130909906 [Corythoichthys intestinalis]|uniref:uncharacterized protein LOC130909906 n=1 Tax=Corythoichthys intestinalis TaxID=161448 RepID=UPI0025A6857B|nr:uncharacterized protein LOC130909906 [Corythoichthys intestinalis]